MFSKVKIFSLFAILSISLISCSKEEPFFFEGKASAEIDGELIKFDNLSSYTTYPLWGGRSFSNGAGDVLELFYGDTTDHEPVLNKYYPINIPQKDAEYFSMFANTFLTVPDTSGIVGSSRMRNNRDIHFITPISFIKHNEKLPNHPLFETWLAAQSKTDDAIGYVVYTKITDTEVEGKFECTLFSRYVVKEGDTLNLAPKKVKNGKFSVRRK